MFTKRQPLAAVLLMTAFALTAGAVAANERAIEFSTKSREALEMVDQITTAIETFQQLPVLTQLSQQLIEADPEWGFAYLVASQFQPGPQALESLKKADELSTSLSDAEKRYLVGAKAIRNGDVPGALEVFQGLASEFPGERRAHMLVGQLELGQGNAKEAKMALEKARQLNDSTPRVFAHLGNCHLLLGDYGKAQDLFRTGLSKADLTATIPFPLLFGNLQADLYQGNVKDALEGVDRLLEVYNTNGGPQGFPAVFIWNLRARIELENGQYQAALDDYERGLKTIEESTSLPPQQAQIWTGRYHHGRARVLAKMGQHQEAWQIAEQLKKEIDEGGDAGVQFLPAYHYLAGYLKLESGDYGAAIEHLINATPTDPFHRMLLARAYLKAGQEDKARELYREVYDFNQVTTERALSHPEASKMMKKWNG